MRGGMLVGGCRSEPRRYCGSIPVSFVTSLMESPSGVTWIRRSRRGVRTWSAATAGTLTLRSQGHPRDFQLTSMTRRWIERRCEAAWPPYGEKLSEARARKAGKPGSECKEFRTVMQLSSFQCQKSPI